MGIATLALLLTALSLRSGLFFGLVVLAAIFVPMERIFALRHQRILRERWSTDVVHFCVNNLLVLVGLAAVLAPLVLASRGLLPTAFQSDVRSQPLGLQLLEALIVAEGASYWSHRASHTVPWLWRFHAVHHSIEEMDWLAAARLHPIDQVFRQSCVFVPLYILGFSKGSFAGVLVLFTFQAIFIHANVRFTFGPLRWLVATPGFHHWHHSNDPRHYNSNFAGELPLLDALFGTLHLPQDQWPSAYGIDHPLPDGYLRQLAMPFQRTQGGSPAEAPLASR